MEWYPLVINPQYEITKTGRIRNAKTKYELKPQNRGGYLRVGLSNDGIRQTYSIHRLVSQQFIPNLENKPEVNHKDYNTLNNNVDNLEWVTRKENTDHKMSGEHGEKLRIKLRETVKKGITANEISVLQLDLDNNILSEFKSMSEAERQTGVNRKSIRFCIRGQRQTAGGFKWELKEGSTTIENNL